MYTSQISCSTIGILVNRKYFLVNYFTNNFSTCDVVEIVVADKIKLVQFQRESSRRFSIILINIKIIKMGCHYAILKILINYCFLCFLLCGKTLSNRNVEYRDTEYSIKNSYENLYEYVSSNEHPTSQISKGMFNL